MVDLLLIHPPTRMDFREVNGIHGPLSDSVPSTSAFEMYPMGFVSILDFLEARGYKVRILNLALKMLLRKRWDPRKLLRRLRARVYGIDFHWMVHLQGVLEVSAILKDLHPEARVILGGFSSSYYHQDLIEEPAVDAIIRGDLAEYSLEEYLRRVKEGGGLEEVPQLTWKENDEIRVNGFLPKVANLDGVRTSYFRLLLHMARYIDPAGAMPYRGWWRNPAAAVFSARGCTENCIHCGGSSSACVRLFGRGRPLIKSPEVLVGEIEEAAGLIGGPIFIGGDTERLGRDYVRQLFGELRRSRVPNHFILEFAVPPEEETLRTVSGAVRSFSIQLSPETHDEVLRRRVGRNFSNEEMEGFIQRALARGCRNVKLFFMIGIPGQTAESVMETVRYAGELLGQYPRGSVFPFLSVMGPFLDPASHLFEHPERFGFQKRRGKLEEFRDAFSQRSWKEVLGYESVALPLDDLLEVHYKAQVELTRLRARHGLIREGQAAERIACFEEEKRALLRVETGGEKRGAGAFPKTNRLYEPREVSFFRLPKMGRLIRTGMKILPAVLTRRG